MASCDFLRVVGAAWRLDPTYKILRRCPNDSAPIGVLFVLCKYKRSEIGMRELSSTGQEWWDNFQKLLEDQIDFPSEYIFKFIVPSENLDDLKSVFGHHPVEVRESRKGNYVSVTARMEMCSSDEVIAVYNAAAEVDDVISL